MNELVRRKVPAVAVPTHRLPRRKEVVVGTRDAVLGEARRLKARGVLHSTGRFGLITEGRWAGHFELELVLVDRPAPPPAPWWARAGVVLGGVMLSGAALFGSLAWLLTSLTATSLALFLGTILAAFVALLWFRFGRRGGRSVVVTQVVNIR